MAMPFMILLACAGGIGIHALFGRFIGARRRWGHLQVEEIQEVSTPAEDTAKRVQKG